MRVLLSQLIEIFLSTDHQPDQQQQHQHQHHRSAPLSKVLMKKRDQSSSNAQKKGASKKSSSKGGSAKLDRKSSRGMIYENEELRLRTININAEVERGQSDIRKLRRENEQLRREIWSLRDEYDRLNKRFKANKYLPDSISEHGQSESNSEDSDSCDTCRGEGDSNDECLADRKQQQHRDSTRQRNSYSPQPNTTSTATTTEAGVFNTYDRCTGSGQQPPQTTTIAATTTTGSPAAGTFETAATKPRDNLHVLFDHLSIVSEENLSNSDGNLTQADASNLSPSQCLGAMSLPRVVGPPTPLTPIELVANQLNDLQSIIPPLSYFENIVKQHSIIDSTASTNTGETVIQTNGWDYNIQSPFSTRKFQPSEASSSNSTSTTMSPSHLNNPIHERESTPQPEVSTNPNSSCYEGNTNNSKPPKHFFSPIKPRLKLDTALAARAAMLAPPAVLYTDLNQPQYDPPDVYISNALASPYYPQSIAGLSLPSVLMPPMQHAPNTYIEPIYATAQKKIHPPDHSQAGGESSKSSINLEQILNEIGTITEDILQLQLEKSKSQERLLADNQYLPSGSNACSVPLSTATTHTQTVSTNNSPTNLSLTKDGQTASMPSEKNRKPYRSEMNLFLSYSGSNPVIVPVAKNTTTTGEGLPTQATTADVVPFDSVADDGAPDREGNSPSPPQFPTPMAPFPSNLMYLAFDRVNPTLVESGDPRYGLPNVGLAYVPPASLPAADIANHPRVVSPAPPPPPTPPQTPNLYAAHEQNDDAIGFQIRHQGNLTLSSPDLSTSPLVATAPLKRRIFSKQQDEGSNSHQITRSFDGVDVPLGPADSKSAGNLTDKLKTTMEGSANEISSYESSSGSEATKRKSRRVSIVCRDDNKHEPTPSEAVNQQKHNSTVSVDRLDDMMPSILGFQKHAHSTPNSPHSNRRRGNSNLAISSSAAAGGSSTLHHHGHHHHHHHHHHSRKLSQESINDATARGTSVANSIVNSSNDNVGPTTSSSVHPHATRYKCSRRHSDGTVASVVGCGSGLRLSGPNSHHHHHHHVESTHETATSISERNSGSLASSRESSTSLSMRSQRRKISVSSHTGGKIPWCGCWGNGCL